MVYFFLDSLTFWENIWSDKSSYFHFSYFLSDNIVQRVHKREKGLQSVFAGDFDNCSFENFFYCNIQKNLFIIFLSVYPTLFLFLGIVVAVN